MLSSSFIVTNCISFSVYLFDLNSRWHFLFFKTAHQRQIISVELMDSFNSIITMKTTLYYAMNIEFSHFVIKTNVQKESWNETRLMLDVSIKQKMADRDI